jgi:hypothetical protein
MDPRKNPHHDTLIDVPPDPSSAPLDTLANLRITLIAQRWPACRSIAVRVRVPVRQSNHVRGGASEARGQLCDQSAPVV